MYTPINYRASLNDEQFNAVINTGGPMLVIASAGTGKTTVLKYRTARLIEGGVAPENLLLLTFTNKAANEMVERINALLDSEDASKITACTYHSFCALVLRQYASSIGLKNNYTILDSSDAVEALKIVLEDSFKDDKELPKAKILSEIFSKFRNMDRTLKITIEEDFPSLKKHIDLIEKVYDKYTEYKLNKNILDYDDLLTETVRLLQTNRNVCKLLSDKYTYIMVDEYQDSNKLQFLILKELRSFKNQNICVVGDEGQCLYTWRGADVKHIMNFPKEFKDCKIVVLKENYRSSNEILKVANTTIECFKYKFDKELKGQFNHPDKPAIILTDDKDKEAEYIVRKIDQILKKGDTLEDIAILIRGARTSTKLEILLNQYGVNFTKYGGLKFLERQYVKDILSFLKLTQNEFDEISWFRVLQLYPNIGTFYAKKVSEDILNNNIEILNDKKYTKVKYGEKLPELCRTIKYLKTLSLKEQLEYLIETYYFKLVEEKTIKSNIKEVTKREILQDNKENKDQSKVLYDLSKDYRTTLSFLTDLTLEPPTTLSDGKGLTVSTIHSAKGLEFKHVFIMDCIEGSMPYVKETSLEKELQALEEERRIFYVACTRAKTNLYVMYPKYSVDYYGKYITNEISRFLTENNNIKNFNKFKK